MDTLTGALGVGGLEPVMVDATQSRFVDVYCNDRVSNAESDTDSD